MKFDFPTLAYPITAISNYSGIFYMNDMNGTILILFYYNQC
jgi:hypothetical protein